MLLPSKDMQDGSLHFFEGFLLENSQAPTNIEHRCDHTGLGETGPAKKLAWYDRKMGDS